VICPTRRAAARDLPRPASSGPSERNQAKDVSAMRTLLSLTAAACSLSACAAGDPADLGADRDPVAQAAGTTQMLACNLEYEVFSPFSTFPAASFAVPYSQVVASGASASDGHYQIAVALNPTPPYNLSFNVNVTNVATGKDAAYSVLPAPVVGGAFLFETGARISSLTKNGVVYDHVRAYCRTYLQ
jgi:hypothetical protein